MQTNIPDTPILPTDINAASHFFGAFDHYETEVSAGWLVRFAQERGDGWAPFRRENIQEYYEKKFSHPFRFNRLLPRYIHENDEDYSFSVEFVAKCYASAPKKPKSGRNTSP